MPETEPTVKAILDAAAGYLERHGIDEARLKCEWLAARLLRCKRLDLYTRQTATLSEAHREAMRRGVRRLARGEPVQYIVGACAFMDLRLACDRRALIPRPETEVLVATALATEGLPQQALAVDIGTGSGCVILALAAARPDWRGIGLDVSAEALALARQNAAALGLQDRIVFAEGELCDVLEAETADLVVANLPYIPSPDIANLPAAVRDHEPRVALDGGPDGLAVLRDIIPDAVIVLRPGGWLMLEIGADQGAAVAGLLQAEGLTHVRVRPDLAGRDRVVTGQAPA